jgi:hypothetical protein
MQRLRRSLERVPTRRQEERRMAVSTTDVVRELNELIAALDRRVPRVAQAGESVIAREAAALRAKAVERLAEITRERESTGRARTT